MQHSSGLYMSLPLQPSFTCVIEFKAGAAAAAARVRLSVRASPPSPFCCCHAAARCSSADRAVLCCAVLSLCCVACVGCSFVAMVKHNNIVPNQHFRKDWQRYVRTWFDQPAKKKARRVQRIIKAKQVAPRPLNLLRPIVHAPTVKYNMKLRQGRGFSLDELKAAGVQRKAALGLGIAVDHRRKNRSEEGFTLNVNRLKLYQSRLVVFPRNPTSKRAKKGDSSKEELAQAKQVTAPHTLPLLATAHTHKSKARKVSKEEREATVAAVLRKALTDEKLWGVREKRAKDKADEAAGKKAKPAAGDEAGGEE